MRTALCLTPFLVLLLALVALPFATAVAPQAAFADDGDENGKEDDDTEPGEDLGDKNLPFAEQVNQAIERGVNWLLARPDFGKEKKYDFAHWGLTDAPQFYGKGKGLKYQNPAGPTALALYTLLKCGVSPKDEIIQKGFNWIREKHKITEKWDGESARQCEGRIWRHTDASSSYELAVMLLALTAKYDQFKKTSATKKAFKAKKLRIRDKDDREWLFEMVQELIERRGQGQENAPREAKLGWRYNNKLITWGNSRTGIVRRPPQPALPTGNQDLSCTQLCCMALFSASRFPGIKIPTQVWRDILEFTLMQQEEEGPDHQRHVPGYIPDRYGKKEWIDQARGFMYIKGSKHRSEGKATGSMTACGVANLLICREMISKKRKDRLEFMESGMLKKVDKAIYDGLAWLDKYWSSYSNRNKNQYHIYYLYCLERAMDLMGKKLVGKRLWYREGALQILKRKIDKDVNIKRRKKGGSHKGVYWDKSPGHDPKDVLATCFALLFLKRATWGMLPPPKGPVVTK